MKFYFLYSLFIYFIASVLLELYFRALDKHFEPLCSIQMMSYIMILLSVHPDETKTVLVFREVQSHDMAFPALFFNREDTSRVTAASSINGSSQIFIINSQT